MILYDYFRSSAAYRVRIALNLKGIAAERRFVHLRRNEQRSAAYLAANPQGLVPTLVDGEVALTQSLAAIEYLDETRPEPPLLPADPAGRARVRALAQLIACDIHPLGNLRVLRYLKDPLGLDAATSATWFNHWIAEGFAALEAHARGPATGRFLHGDAPSLADICLAPQMFNAARHALDLAPYPTLVRVAAAAAELPAFADAHPSRQPDWEA